MTRILMQGLTQWAKRRPILILSLILAITLSMIGANWGRVECWNLDEMAFRGVQPNGLPMGGYLKPPLDTYLNYIFVIKPVDAIVTGLNMDRKLRNSLRLIGSRMLTILLFCGSIMLTYSLCCDVSGRTSAACSALLLATSAGILEYNHFATADSPLLFWMIAAFFMAIQAAKSGRLFDAMIAGLLTGLAAADKYNGVVVGIAIPISMLIHSGWRSLFSRNLFTSGFSVPLGFILGNPGCVFDYTNFAHDFLYNLYTTPVYAGETHQTGYILYFQSFAEILGWPGFLISGIGVFISLYLVATKIRSSRSHVLFFSAASVFIAYTMIIGRFPRMEVRFVLPAAPFLLMMAAPAYELISAQSLARRITAPVFLIIISYNIVCSVLLGLRFLSDPRMDAQLFAKKNFAAGSLVESTYSPEWEIIPGVDVNVCHMPYVFGREERFSKIFGNNKVIQEGIKKFEMQRITPDSFTKKGLKERNPDFITFSDQVYLYTPDPSVRQFYRDLEEGRFGYRKIFDKRCAARIPWTYPTTIDLLAERMIILKKE